MSAPRRTHRYLRGLPWRPLPRQPASLGRLCGTDALLWPRLAWPLPTPPGQPARRAEGQVTRGAFRPGPHSGRGATRGHPRRVPLSGAQRYASRERGARPPEAPRALRDRAPAADTAGYTQWGPPGAGTPTGTRGGVKSRLSLSAAGSPALPRSSGVRRRTPRARPPRPRPAPRRSPALPRPGGASARGPPARPVSGPRRRPRLPARRGQGAGAAPGRAGAAPHPQRGGAGRGRGRCQPEPVVTWRGEEPPGAAAAAASSRGPGAGGGGGGCPAADPERPLRASAPLASAAAPALLRVPGGPRPRRLLPPGRGGPRPGGRQPRAASLAASPLLVTRLWRSPAGSTAASLAFNAPGCTRQHPRGRRRSRPRRWVTAGAALRHHGLPRAAPVRRAAALNPRSETPAAEAARDLKLRVPCDCRAVPCRAVPLPRQAGSSARTRISCSWAYKQSHGRMAADILKQFKTFTAPAAVTGMAELLCGIGSPD